MTVRVWYVSRMMRIVVAIRAVEQSLKSLGGHRSLRLAVGNALQHMEDCRVWRDRQGGTAELTESIETYPYRLQRVPLIVPVTLLQHYARRPGIEYLRGQVDLDPHPGEMMRLNRLETGRSPMLVFTSGRERMRSDPSGL